MLCEPRARGRHFTIFASRGLTPFRHGDNKLRLTALKPFSKGPVATQLQIQPQSLVPSLSLYAEFSKLTKESCEQNNLRVVSHNDSHGIHTESPVVLLMNAFRCLCGSILLQAHSQTRRAASIWGRPAALCPPAEAIQSVSVSERKHRSSSTFSLSRTGAPPFNSPSLPLQQNKNPHRYPRWSDVGMMLTTVTSGLQMEDRPAACVETCELMSAD